MRAFHSPRRLDAKKISHSPVCDSIFLGLSGQKSDDMSSRPTKILKISAFRDFFVTVPKCQKGAKNRVKTRFLRRISILCSSYADTLEEWTPVDVCGVAGNENRAWTRARVCRLGVKIVMMCFPDMGSHPPCHFTKNIRIVWVTHCDRLRPDCDLVAIRSQLISKRPFFELLYNIPFRPIGFPYADNFLVLFQFSHQYLYLVTTKPR